MGQHMKIFPREALLSAAEQVAACGRDIYARGWSPATSSNYSMRLNEHSCAITISGRDKSCLSPDDVMAVDLEGAPLTEGRPSAETLLHTSLYRRFPEIGAVLHTHSLPATVLSRQSKKPYCLLENYELLKAFDGVSSHENTLYVPIFENTQAIDVLAQYVIEYLNTHVDRLCYGYLICGHGLYTWGKTLKDTHRHLEALEFMLMCELEMLKFARQSQ